MSSQSRIDTFIAQSNDPSALLALRGELIPMTRDIRNEALEYAAFAIQNQYFVRFDQTEAAFVIRGLKEKS